MDIEAGEIDTLITIYTRSTRKDAYGSPSDKWIEGDTFWGKLANLNAKTTEIAKGYGANIVGEIKARYVPQVSLKTRLAFDGSIYAVGGVRHDPKKQWTQVFVSEAAE